jgi:hypothetical protein
MFIRKGISENRKLGTALGLILVLIACAAITYQFWPAKKAKLAMAYFSDDDGATWFTDSLDHVPPFDHNGKEAVRAGIFTYDDGSKKFCAFLEKFTPEAKKQLESAIADAAARGQGPETVTLQREPSFVDSGMMMKVPGGQNLWVRSSDPNAKKIMAVQSPDGSAIDACYVY